MDKEHFFKSAKWVGASERTQKTFSVLRGHFFADNANKVSLDILGLGFFKCYINGQCINPDTFLPLSAEYEKNNEPKGESFSGNRIYVPSFDITSYIKNGDNVITVHFGGGWYIHSRAVGLPKAIYCVTVEDTSGTSYFVSDEQCKICKSFVSHYSLLTGETHDLESFEQCIGNDFDDSDCENAVAVENLDTKYCVTKCPWDTLAKELTVKKIGIGKRGIVYDCGQNLSGYPVLRIKEKKGEEVRVYFSENLLSDGNIDPERAHQQQFSIVSDGTECIVQPEFTWFGFRYFEIEGDAEVICVKEIHADIPVTSSFDCDNETLNWIYRTFIHTMLCNMHIGHPSDCPHLERCGYTGDGQLTCHAVFSTLGAKEFYEKWLRDIADGQDMLSGHIQYTAPYMRCGGGPGGWGSAVVEVPYQLYRHYGDIEILKKYYENMRRYIDFLDLHSEYGLVTSDKDGVWCLGDWCSPNVLYPDKNITYADQQVFLPAAYVNTYFKVKSLNRMCEIARIIGRENDIAEYEKKAEDGKSVIRAAYFNTFDGNFIMNVQGANAYAVDLNIPCKKHDNTETTYENMVNYYKELGYLDTGIFATDILIRNLFEKGDGELAVDLLTNDGEQGFEQWRKSGATTFYEYWDKNHCRSYNHPMFGAVTAYLFEYLLGIKQKDNTAGYTSLTISPQAVSKFKRMSGSMEAPLGTISVKYEKSNDEVKFEIVIPSGTEAVFEYLEQKKVLTEGKNIFAVKL